jgi:hypothetical protein
MQDDNASIKPVNIIVRKASKLINGRFVELNRRLDKVWGVICHVKINWVALMDHPVDNSLVSRVKLSFAPVIYESSITVVKQLSAESGRVETASSKKDQFRVPCER